MLENSKIRRSFSIDRCNFFYTRMDLEIKKWNCKSLILRLFEV